MFQFCPDRGCHQQHDAVRVHQLLAPCNYSGPTTIAQVHALLRPLRSDSTTETEETLIVPSTTFAARPRRIDRLAGVLLLGVATTLSFVVGPPASAGVATCGGDTATITGTSDNDTLVGTAGRDVIVGLAGRDSIRGLGGDDVLCGGSGVDDIVAGAGADRVWGGADGRYRGREGDLIEGGPGDDQLSGGLDPSESGGSDNHEDIVSYANSPAGIQVDLDEPTVTGDGIDTIDGFYSVIGSEHADTITAGDETDLVRGLGGPDAINVDSREGEVFGGSGNDTMTLGYVVYGGRGNDQIMYARQFTNGGQGSDLLVGTRRSDNYRGGFGQDTLRGRSGNDFLDGSAGADVVAGGEGDDTLRGGWEADLLRGGAGADVLEPGDFTGGARKHRVADDRAFGDAGSDTISYRLSNVSGGVRIDLAARVVRGVGVDSLRSVENATGTDGDDHLVGNARTNRLAGGEGSDVLRGRRGGDMLMPDNTEDDFAAPGDDTIRGGSGRDLVSYALASGAGGVQVDLAEAVSEGRGSDTLTSIERLAGTYAADTLLGDAANNVLMGLSGDDTLRGRPGVDVARGGGGQDTCSAETTTGCE